MDESNKFRNYIFQQWEKGKENQKQVIDYLKEINSFKSFNDFKEIMSAMIDLEGYQNYYNDEIIELIRSVYLSKVFEDGIKEFIYELFKDKINLGEKYNFYYALYQKFKYKLNFEFPITEEELKKICLERLKRFVHSNEKGLNKCSSLYYLCRDYVDEENKVVLQKEAHTVMRKYIEKNQWEYISSLIRPFAYPIYKDSFPSFTIEPFAEKTFEGWENFWSFLNNFRNTTEYSNNKNLFDKYYKFIESYKGRGYKPFVVEHKEWLTYGIDVLREINNWQVIE